jgi:hypothetical protein
LLEHQRIPENITFIFRTDFYTISFMLLSQTLLTHISQNKLKSPSICNPLIFFIHNLLSSRLLSKYVNTGIYKTIILPVVLYGCETWSLTLREEYRLRVFEKRVLSAEEG